MTPRKLIASLALLGCLAWPGLIQAQFFKDQAFALTRSNPEFLKAFREATAKPSESTVRIQCDGKDAALGMIVGPDGWILTKSNDLKGDVTVKLRDGKTYEARWVGVHQQHDVALLKIEATGLKPVEFTDSKQVGVGNWVASVGPGEDPVAIGVVSVATRTIPKSAFSFPRIDLSKAGYLGVQLVTGSSPPLIDEVMEGTPAFKIGLKKNDMVLTLSGIEMKEVEQFMGAVGKHKPGDVITLKVRRGDIELELKPTLDKRPFDRNSQQNSMGSALSSRTSGYPTVLQHDSVVKPTDCGGPIVDLQGRVVGINICRAGRTESYAVPSEALQPLFFDMMAGKLPPKLETAKLTLEQQLATARKAFKRAEDEKAGAEKRLADLRTALAKLEDQARAIAKAAEASKNTETLIAAPKRTKEEVEAGNVDKLVELMQKRLQLMKDVAGAKWQAKQTGPDAQREQELLDALVTQGTKLGLTADVVRGFFTVQFDVAKQVQQTYFDRFQKDKVELKNVPDLQKDLRPKLDQVSQDLLTALAQLQPSLSTPAVQQRLRDRAAALLAGDGITEAIRNRALEPLLKR